MVPSHDSASRPKARSARHPSDAAIAIAARTPLSQHEPSISGPSLTSRPPLQSSKRPASAISETPPRPSAASSLKPVLWLNAGSQRLPSAPSTVQSAWNPANPSSRYWTHCLASLPRYTLADALRDSAVSYRDMLATSVPVPPPTIKSAVIPPTRTSGPTVQNRCQPQFPATKPRETVVSLTSGKYSRFGCNALSLNHAFATRPHFNECVLPLVRSSFLTLPELLRLRLLSSSWRNILQAIVWASAITPRYDLRYCPDRSSFSHDRAANLLLLAIRCDLNIGTLVRALYPAGCTAHSHASFHRLQHILEKLVTADHFRHLQRLLAVGAPSRLVAELRWEERLAHLSYGNHPGGRANPQKLDACLLKDERNNHSISLPSWSVAFLPNVMSSPLSVIVRQGKKDRVISDCSFRTPVALQHEGTIAQVSARSLNDVTDMADSHFISYSHVVQDQLEWAYLLRLSRPSEPLYMGIDDVSGAFKHCRLHPDVVGAYGCFTATGLLFAMSLVSIFGKIDAPSEYMLLGDARAALAEFLISPDGAPYLADWFPREAAPIHLRSHDNPQEPLVTVEADSRFQPLDRLPVTPMRPFVDDTGVIDIASRVITAQQASILALHLLIPPSPDRPEVIALEKLHHPCETADYLGFHWDLRRMTLAIQQPKRIAFQAYLTSTFHSHRKTFTLREAAQVLGTVRTFAAVTWWLSYLGVSLQHSLTLAIRVRAPRLLDRWRQHLTSHLKHKVDGWLPAKSVEACASDDLWNSTEPIYITNEVRRDFDCLQRLMNSPDTTWTTPIAHLVKRDPHIISYGDASGTGIGFYCPTLRIMGCLPLPGAVAKLTGSTSSIINDLELAALVLQFAAIISFPHRPTSQWPVLQLWTDNMTARRRLLSGVSSSSRSRRLLHLLCHLAQGTNVSVRSDHIAGKANTIADYLSRDVANPRLTLSQVQRRFPETAGCLAYHPPSWLTTLIFFALLQPQELFPTNALNRLLTTASTPSASFFRPSA